MLTNLKLYKVFTYILIPIALLFGFLDLIILMISLANPSGLFGVFIIACFVLYTFTSFKFYKQGVEQNLQMKKSLKDFVKVNAFVSLFFAVLLISQSVYLLNNNLDESMKAMSDMANQQPGYSQEAFKKMAQSVIKGTCIFFIITGLICFFHVLITLRLLKKHEDLFESSSN